MRALVTGGGGFLGETIVRQLLETGYTVRTFSRGEYPALYRLGAECVQGDLADYQAVDEACHSCDVVFHVAAKAGYWGKYNEYYNTNVRGTENVIRACRRRNISRLVYTSTPSVVLDGQDREGVNEAAPYASYYKAPYPQTKAIAEGKIIAANDGHLATVSLRPHLIWGPGDRHLVPRILERGRRGKLFKIGHVSKLVDFTYVDNAAEAHLLAAARLEPGSTIAGRSFFISDGQPVALWEFINRLLQSANLPPVTRAISHRLTYGVAWSYELAYSAMRIRGEPRLTRFLVDQLSSAHWFDISAARELLGYQPRISIDEGLARLARWLASL